MAKMMVRNYFKPNAPQIKCESMGKTADGLEIWTVDKGQGLAVLQNGVLFRICDIRHLDALRGMELLARVREAVERVYQTVTGEGSQSTHMGCSPAEFELAGRLADWHQCRAVIDQRKADAQAAREAREAAERLETEKLYQQLLDDAADEFKAGREISAEAFEGLLDRHNIKCPIKTLGWIRKALSTIRHDQYAYFKGFNKSQTVMDLARELTEKLAEPIKTESEPVDPEVARLFGQN